MSAKRERLTCKMSEERHINFKLIRERILAMSDRCVTGGLPSEVLSAGNKSLAMVCQKDCAVFEELGAPGS